RGLEVPSYLQQAAEVAADTAGRVEHAGAKRVRDLLPGTRAQTDLHLRKGAHGRPHRRLRLGRLTARGEVLGLLRLRLGPAEGAEELARQLTSLRAAHLRI